MCKCRDCSRSTPVRLYPESEPRIYRTIRFRLNGKPRTLRNGLTLSEAQAHCERDDTRGPGWFDGYDYMRGCAPKAGD